MIQEIQEPSSDQQKMTIPQTCHPLALTKHKAAVDIFRLQGILVICIKNVQVTHVRGQQYEVHFNIVSCLSDSILVW